MTNHKFGDSFGDFAQAFAELVNTRLKYRTARSKKCIHVIWILYEIYHRCIYGTIRLKVKILINYYRLKLAKRQTTLASK